MDYNKRPYFYGTGRRKTSVARVRLYAGTGSVKINGVSFILVSVLMCEPASSSTFAPSMNPTTAQ